MDGIKLFEHCNIDRATQALPHHINQDSIELRIFHKGIQIFYIDHSELVVNGGDILVIPAGAEYSTGHHPQYKTNFHRLQILCANSTSLLGLNQKRSCQLRTYLSSLSAHHYYGNTLLINLISSAFHHVSSDQPSVRLQGRGELLYFLFALENLLEAKAPERAPDINIAYQYINDHIKEELRLQDLANLTGCSLSYFKERFTSQTGVTPMYYINWRKIAYAKRMISQNHSVTEVASLLNFTTPAYFSTVFKNYTSRTPMQYKAFVDIELRKQRHVTSKI